MLMMKSNTFFITFADFFSILIEIKLKQIHNNVIVLVFISHTNFFVIIIIMANYANNFYFKVKIETQKVVVSHSVVIVAILNHRKNYINR